jgi:hypothetical protein
VRTCPKITDTADDDLDAAGTDFRVGCEAPANFSRDYKNPFSAPRNAAQRKCPAITRFNQEKRGF